MVHDRGVVPPAGELAQVVRVRVATRGGEERSVRIRTGNRTAPVAQSNQSTHGLTDDHRSCIRAISFSLTGSVLREITYNRGSG